MPLLLSSNTRCSSSPMERTPPLLLLCFANHPYCVALAGSKWRPVRRSAVAPQSPPPLPQSRCRHLRPRVRHPSSLCWIVADEQGSKGAAPPSIIFSNTSCRDATAGNPQVSPPPHVTP
nr:hypothetical protein Itr_chr01CG06300 [Ipomoea trifida]GLL21811.1 hypothetical protein Itr_chr03CG08300 [Ipomoea trifida]GLL21812.1 hypothetical protein Itr_chr03CG08310 [Ipomoea trifida]GLL29643.1 hypothetical protein Itr_chr06CG13340 [Ipomoea trifida]